MNRKSLESHQTRRTCANFQRGNTRDQRISKTIALVLDDHPKQMINIVKELKNNVISDLNYAGDKWYRCIYFFKDNNDGQENKIAITINEKYWNQTIDVVNEKTQDRYVAENVSNEKIQQEIVNIIKFLETWNLSEHSTLKEFSFENMIEEFDASERVPEKVIQTKPFNQQTYDKILAEEGPEEAVKYGKWLRGEEKPKDDQEK
jgi:hypothetical protein